MKREAIRLGKKGSWKYDFIIVMIIALIVLVIIVFMIYKEYFTQSDVNWQRCRQSIDLRNSIPEVVGEARSIPPLECKTETVNINYKNLDRAERAVGDALVRCWQLVGEGKASIYPPAAATIQSYCLFCARITFDDSVKEFYKDTYEIDNRIDFQKVLSKEVIINNVKTTYRKYLKMSKTAGAGLEVPSDRKQNIILQRYINPGDSMFIIVVSHPGLASHFYGLLEGTGNVGSVLIWAQSVGMDVDELVRNLGGSYLYETNLCSNVEGYVA